MRLYDATGASTTVVQLPRSFEWMSAALDTEHVAAVGQAKLPVLKMALRSRLDRVNHAVETIAGTQRARSEDTASPAITKFVEKTNCEAFNRRRQGRGRGLRVWWKLRR